MADAQAFREEGEGEGREDGAGQGAHAARVDHDEDQGRGQEAVLGGVGDLEQVGQEAARDAGEEGADDEAHDLVAGRVHTAELGGQLVLADGEHGPPVGRLHEVAQEHDGQQA